MGGEIMMGHRGRLHGAAEWDALTMWRKHLHWKPGEIKIIKRRYNKRQRKIAATEIRECQALFS